MNLHNDLLNVKISHSCADCKRKCERRVKTCENFYPVNITEFLDNVLYTLRGTITPSNENKLKRHAYSDGDSFDDGITTLDEYYVQFINTVLSEIRAGRSDYVFNFEQVREIMRFEPDIKVTYISVSESYRIEKRRREFL